MAGPARKRQFPQDIYRRLGRQGWLRSAPPAATTVVPRWVLPKMCWATSGGWRRRAARLAGARVNEPAAIPLFTLRTATAQLQVRAGAAHRLVKSCSIELSCWFEISRLFAPPLKTSLDSNGCVEAVCCQKKATTKVALVRSPGKWGAAGAWVACSPRSNSNNPGRVRVQIGAAAGE